MLRISLTYASLLLFLTSCSSIHTPYPGDWSPVINTKSGGNKCPKISGIYYERGKVAVPGQPGHCPPFIEACTSLSYDLLEGNIGYKQILGARYNLTIGNFVELRQPADERLEVIQLQSSVGGKQILSKHVLLMDKGDFTCDSDGVTLKQRLIYYLVVQDNIIGSVSMSFKPSEAGSLILKMKAYYMGNFVMFPFPFVPFAHAEDLWVRWLPATSEQIDFEPISRVIDIEVRDSIYADQSREALLHQLKQGKDAQLGEAEELLQKYYDTVMLDHTQAHRWLCKSADLGHPDARFRLALLYENGNEGVRKDYVMAYLWYWLAGASGNYWGGKNALRLRKDYLGPKAIKNADEMTRNWQSGQCEREIFRTEPNFTQ